LLISAPLLSDVLYLRNGKRLYVERSWEDAGKVHYEKNGNVYTFSKELVVRVESGSHASDPREAVSMRKSVPVEILEEALDLTEGLGKDETGIIHDGQIDDSKLRRLESEAQADRQDPIKKNAYLNALQEAVQWNVKRGNFISARTYLEPYLRFDPEDLQANLTLAWVNLKQGQYQQAENTLLRAKIKNDGSPDLHYLLGISYYLQDKNELASRTLRHSLALRYRPEVEDLLEKIEQENRAENQYKQANSLHFIVRYEGSAAAHALGQGILASLEKSFMELQEQLNYSPRESVAVVLYPDQVFQDVTRTPNWVGALNDGKIRFPIKGLSYVDRQVDRILKHELTHSFLRLKTAGVCPVWLNEGMAQYFSGDSSQKFQPLAKQAISENRFPPLSELEGPFLGLGPAMATWAYQESLLAVEFLVKTYGLSDVQSLLTRMGQAGSFEAASKETLRRDYTELQQEFEDYVRRH
jgi:tetratricopeptide (TPR) repeat protein